MKTVGVHGLKCLDGNDPGGAALYLQTLATSAEAALGAAFDDLTSAVNRPTTIWAPPGNIAGVTFTNVESIFTTSPFTNASNPPFVTFSSGTYPNFPTGGTLGTYAYGFYLAITPAGVPLDTLESFTMVVMSPATSFPTLSVASDVVQDTATGGENLSSSAVFQANVLNHTDGVPIVVTGSVQSAAGTFTVLSTSYMWATYIGPPDFVELS